MYFLYLEETSDLIEGQLSDFHCISWSQAAVYAQDKHLYLYMFNFYQFGIWLLQELGFCCPAFVSHEIISVRVRINSWLDWCIL